MIQEDHAVARADALSREALETELVLASRMRSLAHVHGVLAHDLKAPLNAMQLALDLLADSLANPDPSDGPAAVERRQRYIGILREEITRLDRALRALLEQKEPIASASEAFDLREVIQEIARLLLPPARRARVEMQLDLPGVAMMVTGYRDRLKQALLGLALRGIDAMPGGGQLRIVSAAQGESVVVTVEDAGAVLQPGRLPDEACIGLYLARLVAESHGGELVSEGRPGEGARFRLSLPRG